MTNPDKMRENELLTSKGSNSMDFGLKNIRDFATNIDKLNLADLVAEVIDKIMEFHILLNFRKLHQKVKQHGYGFKKILAFVLDVDKLTLAYLVATPRGEADGRDHGVPEFRTKMYKKIKARDLQKIIKPSPHRKSQNLSQKPFFKATIAKPPKA